MNRYPTRTTSWPDPTTTTTVSTTPPAPSTGPANECDEDQFGIPEVAADGTLHVHFINGQNDVAPEPARIRAHNEHLRRAAWSQFIIQVGAKAPLRNGLTPQEATDILLMLMGPASYQTLVGEYGWTPKQWREWCHHAIATMLFTVGCP